MPYVIEQNKDLSEMSLHVITIFSDSIREDEFDVLTLEEAIAAGDRTGGTAPGKVRLAVKIAGQW